MSKGLGAPGGGVRAGSHKFIARALRHKHRFGGAMRRAGIIAAAGAYPGFLTISRLRTRTDRHRLR